MKNRLYREDIGVSSTNVVCGRGAATVYSSHAARIEAAGFHSMGHS